MVGRWVGKIENCVVEEVKKREASKRTPRDDAI